MSLPGSMLVTLCLQAGELRQQLNAYSEASMVQVLFDYAQVGLWKRPAFCPRHRLTANQAIAGVLAGTRFTWEWIPTPSGHPTLAVRDIDVPCRPELGVDAPVPPCLGPALVVRRRGG